MYSGRPSFLTQIMPRWMTPTDFYISLGVGICLIVLVGAFVISRRNATASRIRAIQERRKILHTQSTTPKKRKKPETSVNFMRTVVTRLQLLKKTQIGNAESQLVEAGFRSKDAIYVLTFFNLVLPILLAILGFIFMKYRAAGLVSIKAQRFNYIWPILGAYIGLKLPGFYVSRVRKKRYLSIQKSLPDVLDLMTICAEAGLSLVSMLDRVSRELSNTYVEMAEELSMTSIEIGFLPERNKALANLAERCTLPEVRGIVSVLIQTEKYGTPIAQALRVLSAEFRQARMLRAEQKAARLPALMTIPMIVFILPTLFIVILAPAIVNLLNTIASH